MHMKKIASCFIYAYYAAYYALCMLIGIFARNFKTYKNLWLVSERKYDARDNGFFFFEYLTQNHPEINCAYVISKNSADFEKVKRTGRVIEPKSFSHMLAFAVSKVRISTHYMGPAPDTYRFAVMKRIGLIRGKDVFLQHGIIANDAKELHYPNAKIDLFICTADKEYEFIKNNFGHKDGVVKKIGLCRYDRLKSNIKKQILVMPTWRNFLINLTDEEFVKSEYYKNFQSLINDKMLNSALKENGYEIILYLHFELQKFSHLFKADFPTVKIADFKSSGVRELLVNSSLLVTDYSSVFFDFAYMEKPVLYFWFDEDKFFAAQYDRGYFDCRKDGFGPVAETSGAALDFIIKKLNGGMKTDDVYKKRADLFFGEKSLNRCEKTYKEILKII